MEIIKLDLSLNASRGRLIAKKYDQKSKPIPHSALPLNVSEPLEQIYVALAGEEKFNPETETFRVVSSNGKFKNLYSPQLVADNNANCLVVKWGESILPVYLRDGNLTMVNGIYENLKKPKITFVEEDFGEYKKVVAKFTIPKGKKVYVTSIPVKLIDYKDIKGTADYLNMCVDQDDIELLFEKISDIGDTGNGGSDVTGYVIKPGHLPLGCYKLTNFYSYESPHGKGYVVQAVSEEMLDEEGEHIHEFMAIATIKDAISGEYLKEEVIIHEGEPFAINANKSMKKVFHSGPIINDDKPAKLTITKKFEYNGNPAVKLDLEVDEFIVDESSFQTDW